MFQLLAHLGGLDEIGIFVLPAAAIIYFLRRAEKKAKERLDAEEAEAPPGGSREPTDHAP